MAAKKKTSKKQIKTKRTARKKMAPVKKKAVRRKLAKKKSVVKAKGAARKTKIRKTTAAPKKPIRGKSQSVDTVAFVPKGLGARSGGQSGDLQGLSNRESANSESVDELLEEGNAFEAEVVKGVEDAGDADESEVHTHEVPEDDVPGEYQDKE
ncbi:MAG: hypothetical protein PVS2B2_22890 [Candidatus Acidiferrum sp.]